MLSKNKYITVDWKTFLGLCLFSFIIIFIFMGTYQVITNIKWRQLSPETRQTISDLAADSAASVISDSIAFPIDTIALKLLNMDEGRVAYLKDPAGWWTVIDSAYTESFCIIAAPHPTQGLQWVWNPYRINKTISLLNAGGDRSDDATNADSLAMVRLFDVAHDNCVIYFPSGTWNLNSNINEGIYHSMNLPVYNNITILNEGFWKVGDDSVLIVFDSWETSGVEKGNPNNFDTPIVIDSTSFVDGVELGKPYMIIEKDSLANFISAGLDTNDIISIVDTSLSKWYNAVVYRFLDEDASDQDTIMFFQAPKYGYTFGQTEIDHVAIFPLKKNVKFIGMESEGLKIKFYGINGLRVDKLIGRDKLYEQETFSGTAAINITTCANTIISDCIIEGYAQLVSRYGISLADGCIDVYINNCRLMVNGHSISMGWGGAGSESLNMGIRVSNCTIGTGDDDYQGSTVPVGSHSRCYDLTFSNCEFIGVAYAAWGNDTNVLFDHCYFKDCRGIYQISKTVEYNLDVKRTNCTVEIIGGKFEGDIDGRLIRVDNDAQAKLVRISNLDIIDKSPDISAEWNAIQLYKRSAIDTLIIDGLVTMRDSSAADFINFAATGAGDTLNNRYAIKYIHISNSILVGYTSLIAGTFEKGVETLILDNTHFSNYNYLTALAMVGGDDTSYCAIENLEVINGSVLENGRNVFIEANLYIKTLKFESSTINYTDDYTFRFNSGNKIENFIIQDCELKNLASRESQWINWGSTANRIDNIRFIDNYFPSSHDSTVWAEFDAERVKFGLSRQTSVYIQYKDWFEWLQADGVVPNIKLIKNEVRVGTDGYRIVDVDSVKIEISGNIFAPANGQTTNSYPFVLTDIFDGRFFENHVYLNADSMTIINVVHVTGDTVFFKASNNTFTNMGTTIDGDSRFFYADTGRVSIGANMVSGLDRESGLESGATNYMPYWVDGLYLRSVGKDSTHQVRVAGDTLQVGAGIEP